ncbi:MAG TPA: sigma-70 family RNA polymerase sigma factor [Candidatus Binatia bacterium]|nr:sigma-70 family RNA polymerase sigma factor [Candidatus Binatia bacterium]
MTSEHSTPEGTAPSAFVTTQWTQVLEARGDSPEAKAALSDLCAAYYAPVFAFIRRNAAQEDSAKDLTQEFFTRLLARQGIATVDPQRGRFRSFLLGAVKHFLADMRDHAHRLKRGAGQLMETVEPGTDTSPGLQVADPNAPSPDREFDRKWALTLLDRALAALAREHEASGKADHFETLKPWLTGDTENISQADAAARLGLNEGAVKVAIHRLRRRFREVIKSEIGQTVSERAQVEAEMHYLLEALL